MAGASVERVLAELRRENPPLAEQAAAAVEWLSAGGEFELSQYRLQEFLWYQLPRKWLVPPDEEARLFVEVREGLAWVLARLGLDRYAFICRSAITEGVHAADLESEEDGLRAFQQAMEGSGIEPPDLDDFRWGELKGIEEAHAQERVAEALEGAVASGELAVNSRGWRSQQRRLAATALDQPHPDGRGVSGLQVIIEERIERWSEASRGQGLSALRRRAAPQLGAPIAPPQGVEEAFEPLRWFLEAAGDGIRLTQTGNLNRAFVVEATQERGWWPLLGAPRSEDEVIELIELHDIARALRAVRRSGRTLRSTAAGREFIGRPEQLWERFVASLAGRRGFQAVALEALALFLLERRSVVPRSLVTEELAALLAAEGYRPTSGGEALSARDMEWQIGGSLRLLELFKMIVVSGEWDARRLALTPAGEATLRALLRARASAPLVWESV